MEIDYKEKMKLMNLLDRIEFRQRYLLIDKEYEALDIFNNFWKILTLGLILLFIVDIWSLLRIGEWTLTLIEWKNIMLYFSLGLMLAIGYDFFCLGRKRRKIRELENEYFDVEVKVRRK